ALCPRQALPDRQEPRRGRPHRHRPRLAALPPPAPVAGCKTCGGFVSARSTGGGECSTPSPLARLVARIVGRVHEDDLERPHAVHLDDPLALPRYPAEMRHLRREHEIGAGGKLARPPLLELLAH